MAYWNWVGWYLVLSLVNLASLYVVRSYPLLIVTSFLCIVYFLVFLIWPYLLSIEQKSELVTIAEGYKKEEEKVDLRIQEKMKDWVVVRIYNDLEESVQFGNDKKVLDEKKIDSIAKSTSGITTLSVQSFNADTACAVLGIELPMIDDEKGSA